MKKRKRKAVRMFEHGVGILLAHDSNISSKTGGRLEQDLRNYKHRLRKLSEEDPEELFWPTLQKAILKLIKYVLRLRR